MLLVDCWVHGRNISCCQGAARDLVGDCVLIYTNQSGTYRTLPDGTTEQSCNYDEKPVDNLQPKVLSFKKRSRMPLQKNFAKV